MTKIMNLMVALLLLGSSVFAHPAVDVFRRASVRVSWDRSVSVVDAASGKDSRFPEAAAKPAVGFFTGKDFFHRSRHGVIVVDGRGKFQAVFERPDTLSPWQEFFLGKGEIQRWNLPKNTLEWGRFLQKVTRWAEVDWKLTQDE